MTPQDSPQWLTAKAAGDDAESAVAEFFRQRGWTTLKTLGFADFDLQLQCTVEVKHDRKATKTGNVAIEVSYRGAPSGIMSTSAAWFVIATDKLLILAKTDDLRKLVIGGVYPEVSAGDEHRTRVRLVPIDDLRGAKNVHLITLPSATA